MCVSAQTKDLESVCMIGTQCRCVGSGCHLEKAEWAGSGREWGRLLCLPPPPKKKNSEWFDRKIKETMGV